MQECTRADGAAGTSSTTYAGKLGVSVVPDPSVPRDATLTCPFHKD